MGDNNDFFANYGKHQEGKLKEIEENIEENDDIEENSEVADESSRQLHYNQSSGFKPPKQIHSSARDIKRAEAKKKKIIYGSIGGGIAAILLIWLIITLLTSGVEVIDLYERKLSDAQLWANQNDIILQVEKEYNDEIETDRIISQDVKPGEKIKKGDFLRVYVSLGHDLSVTLTLPDLMNMTSEEIDKWVADNYMSKVRITTENSSTVAAGKVIRYEINDATVVDEVRRDTPIYIIISKGASTSETVKVTDLKGKTLADCQEFAKENGIVLKIIEEYDEYVTLGVVIKQSIKAGETIHRGDELSVTISKGKMIVIPSFSGLTKEKAMAKATELGLVPQITEVYSSSKKGAFISQSIPEDSIFEPGDLLELKYSLGNTVPIASFVGQTKDTIDAWKDGLNELGAKISINSRSTQSSSPEGTIIYQDQVNKTISYKSTINIIISMGKNVYVPDFIGPENSTYETAITRENAMAMCAELNLVPIFEEGAKANRLPGEIWSQSEPAGKEVAQGTRITLKYCPTNKSYYVPNFVTANKTEYDIRQGTDVKYNEKYMKMFNIEFVYDDESVPGKETVCIVYKQSVRADSTVASGTKITIYLREP